MRDKDGLSSPKRKSSLYYIPDTFYGAETAFSSILYLMYYTHAGVVSAIIFAEAYYKVYMYPV